MIASSDSSTGEETSESDSISGTSSSSSSSSHQRQLRIETQQHTERTMRQLPFMDDQQDEAHLPSAILPTQNRILPTTAQPPLEAVLQSCGRGVIDSKYSSA